MKNIDDIAIDRSRSYAWKYKISRLKHFFNRLFPRFYLWRLERVIRKYEKLQEEWDRQK